MRFGSQGTISRKASSVMSGRTPLTTNLLSLIGVEKLTAFVVYIAAIVPDSKLAF